MIGGLFGAGWEMTPTPILLALPSSPMAIIVGNAVVLVSVQRVEVQKFATLRRGDVAIDKDLPSV
jgi:uncharacterized membrane protein YfcA